MGTHEDLARTYYETYARWQAVSESHRMPLHLFQIGMTVNARYRE
jgi:hypothetical protein